MNDTNDYMIHKHLYIDTITIYYNGGVNVQMFMR